MIWNIIIMKVIILIKSFFSLFLDFIILSFSLSLSFKANRKLKLSIIDLLINIRTNNK
jgi:hypothetical protein